MSYLVATLLVPTLRHTHVAAPVLVDHLPAVCMSLCHSKMFQAQLRPLLPMIILAFRRQRLVGTLLLFSLLSSETLPKLTAWIQSMCFKTMLKIVHQLLLSLR